MNPGETFAFMVGVQTFYESRGASKQAMEGIAAVQAQLRRTEKLETALTELVGFAKRNVERAKKAHETAGKAKIPNDGQAASENAHVARIEAAARFHEAQRVYDVIRMRVKEALAP